MVTKLAAAEQISRCAYGGTEQLCVRLGKGCRRLIPIDVPLTQRSTKVHVLKYI
jgi:hypothetical protein